MDIVAIGTNNEKTKESIDLIVEGMGISIEWDYDTYKIESQEGLELYKSKKGLSYIGILTDSSSDTTFSSYPLIYEISEKFMDEEGKHRPKLFDFFNLLIQEQVTPEVICFSDVWINSTPVRIEKISIDKVIERINTFYVWCDTATLLESDSEIRIDHFPLILEIDSVPSDKE